MTVSSTPYDDVPYTSHSFPQSHPDRLAAVAKLFGMEAPPIENCRVLELGCSMGGNLLAMAQKHPRSQFIGIDSSSRQIAQGWKAINLLGLKNVRLQHLDILDVGEDFGEFDYIVSHGIFSWVPLAVQTKMFELTRRHLVPNGVAYFSYNTYPGWRIREITREMMLYRGQQFRDPATRLAQAKELVGFVAAAAFDPNDPYRQLLHRELEGLGRGEDYYLYHEHLEENNHPIYFHEFARRLAVNGLQYLGEADVSTMVATNFAPNVARKLLELGAKDIIQTEQYMDFVRCRCFRETIVCHSAIELNRQLRPAVVKGMLLTSQAQPKSEVSTPSDTEVFQVPDGRGITCRSKVIRTALRELLRQFPSPISFADLAAYCQAHLPATDLPADGVTLEDFLATELLSCLAAGIIEWYVSPVSYTTVVEEFPMTTPHARWQASQGTNVVNIRGELVSLDVLHSRLLQHLDGKHSWSQLADELLAHVQRGGHELRRDDNTLVTDPGEARQLLGVAVEKALHNLAKNALLCATSIRMSSCTLPNERQVASIAQEHSVQGV